MKNIHVLPTDKPSRLVKIKDNLFYTTTKNIPGGVYQHIYITSDEEIKDGDYRLNIQRGYFMTSDKEGLEYYNRRNDVFKKIILTTDQDLIKDGVQPIDDEFLEWFVKNPSCEWVEVILNEVSFVVQDNVYKIIIPQEEPKQETLEEVAHKMLVDYGIKSIGQSIGVLTVKKLMVNMAKWQAERMYSEEEVIEFGEMIAWNMVGKTITESFIRTVSKELFQQFKKK